MKITVLFLLCFLFTSFLSVAQTRFELPAGKYMIELSQEIMRGEVGKSNATHPVRIAEYLDSANHTRYYNPFCASGPVWAFKKARAILKYINQLLGMKFITDLPYPASALANTPYNHAINKGTKTNYIPHKYDKLIWRVATGINGHIETIDSVLSGGWVRTIAFNTDNRQVKYKKRNIYHILGRLQVRGLVGFRYESN